MIIEKCVNIPIIPESFINMLKNSAVKTIKTIAKVIVIITVKKYSNAKCIKLPNYELKENEYENMQNLFSFFLRYFQKKVSLGVRFWEIEDNDT